ncbi:hypothetical protein GCK32_022436 [Trichostrongylus colubriformis]|uniref:C-type lectin domain-containing protein n=1 Tax=Trichostrongylus colubriformis TaxID=6319 RepID=A0AAN8FUF5_TRICO
MRRNPNNRKELQWMSGSTCSYGNWDKGEPNDWGGYETYIHFYSDDEGYYTKWNDQIASKCHYLCERSKCPQEDVV